MLVGQACEKLIVAASVNDNQQGTKLTAAASLSTPDHPARITTALLHCYGAVGLLFVNSPSEPRMQITEGMEVITSDGQTLGIIEHLLVPDSLRIKTGGHSHIILTLWVLQVTDKVHLIKYVADAKAGWV